MATIVWKTGKNGDFEDGANWVGGIAPGGNDNAAIKVDGTYAVAIDSASAASSLVVDDSGATLDIANGGKLSVGATLTASSGTVELDTGGVISGGALRAGAIGAFVWNGGTLSGTAFRGPLSVAYTDALHVAGSGLTLTGPSGTGNGAMNLAGNLFMEGDQTLDHATINLGSGVGGAAIVVGNGDPHSKAGASTLTLGPSLTINQTGSIAEIDILWAENLQGQTLSQTLVNNGVINAKVNAQVSGRAFTIGNDEDDFETGQFVNNGTVNIANGGALEINSNDFENGTAGSINVGSGSQLGNPFLEGSRPSDAP